MFQIKGPILAAMDLDKGSDELLRQADGLAESLTTAITISPRGDVWVKHGEVEAVSWLDGWDQRPYGFLSGFRFGDWYSENQRAR